jgi:hypothetical protein
MSRCVSKTGHISIGKILIHDVAVCNQAARDGRTPRITRRPTSLKVNESYRVGGRVHAIVGRRVGGILQRIISRG